MTPIHIVLKSISPFRADAVPVLSKRLTGIRVTVFVDVIVDDDFNVELKPIPRSTVWIPEDILDSSDRVPGLEWSHH